MLEAVNLEQLILRNLLFTEAYVQKVLPFLKAEYFRDEVERIIFEHINTFVNTYKTSPTKKAIVVQLGNLKTLNESQYKAALLLLAEMKREGDQENLQWLVEETENWCKDQALYSAAQEVIEAVQNTKERFRRGSLPKTLSDALSVSFETSVGHDFVGDAGDRWDYFNRAEHKIPFDIDFFNRITRGGFAKSTLNVILAPPSVGKSLFMCHFAAAHFMLGKNVLYLTLEMEKEMIASRIDANRLGINSDDIYTLPRETFVNRIEKLPSVGKLKTVGYPTGSANVNHFRHLIEQYKIRQNFIPDIVYVDYLNIMAATTVKPDNLYAYGKAVGEELRGLAQELCVPIVTAAQVNRSGYKSTDIGMENVAESAGINAIADWIIGLISTDELEQMNQILVKQIKNRYNGIHSHKKFLVGVDKPKFKLYDIEESAQLATIQSVSEAGNNKFEKYTRKNTSKEQQTKAEEELEDIPLFDQCGFGKGMKGESGGGGYAKKRYDDVNF